ncbi:hypothetical protein CkaCkLH20_09106 [Colletotrichum karsti]|uniref:Uncharacterized protein n=1 Tax=Colletotrichum karsti TaxID=1095194 RepID=A0A9P6HXH0_9PEZI|nr:uncharacterized protein CkaCkLH20_09106 [Colletotrichum karsti]KAF9873293.1 hypothetical protein CkaCkLH20_09106 [Colletotrichum karsti]
MNTCSISDEDFAPWANNAVWLVMEKKFPQFQSKDELAFQLQKQNPTTELLTDQKTRVKRANLLSEYATVQVVYQSSNTTNNPNIRLCAFIFCDNLIVTIATRALLQQEYTNNPAATKSKWRQIDNLGFLSKHVNEFQGPRAKLTAEEVGYLSGSDILAKELQRINRAHQGQIKTIYENHRKEKEEIENQAQQLLNVDEDSMVNQLSKKCSELEEENAAVKEENAILKKQKATLGEDIKYLQLDNQESLKMVKVSEEKRKALTTIVTAIDKKTKTADEDELLISL